MGENRRLDPEEEGLLVDPYDPEEEGLLVDPYDPEEEGLLVDPYDPEEEGLLVDPYDPEEEGLLVDPYDPEEEGLLVDPYDPEGQNARREDALRSAQRGRSYDRPGAENADIRAAKRRYSGTVVIRLSSLLPVTDYDNLYELAEELGLGGLTEVLERFGSPGSKREITVEEPGTLGQEESSAGSSQETQARSAGTPDEAGPNDCERPRPPVTLDELERRAATSDFAPLHSLWSYWRLDGRNLKATTGEGKEVLPENGFPYTNNVVATQFVKRLNALSEVDLAYRELEASDPDQPDTFVPPSEETLSDMQFSLGEAPMGLDARWAREQIGEPAEKIALADLEQGWIPNHEDLEGANLVHGDNRHGQGNFRGNHGTAVVSQIVAKRGNRLGIVGIAPGVATLSLASHYKAGEVEGTGTAGHVANAITALITGDPPALGPGDVLLLEVQRDGGKPTEFNPADFDAIRLAVASGVIVVEAAGNGRLNLDRLRTDDGRSLKRGHYDFRDSGAIMVGAARAAAPHNRSWFSNYGSRVDCFGWGDSVVAAGYGDYLGGDDSQIYTDTFSGTSSAAPMIAGAAVLVQSLYLQNAAPRGSESWKRLSPVQMRSLLSDPRTGTRQGHKVRGRIGVMPNLRAVVGKALGIVPQVYLRDHVGDAAKNPAERRCCSPDIIVTKEADGKLEKTFGQGSSSANQDIFDVSLDSPGEKRVLVRVCNRGLQEAKKVTARIYRAPVCTLVTPDRWQELTQASPVSMGDVPQGDTFALSETVKYDQAEPKSLVAVVEVDGSKEGPESCHASNFDWKRHLRVMRSQHNVAVRNVHSVDVNGDGTRGLSFIINGTPDAPRAFEFEVIQRLPKDVTVKLRTHLAVALKFARGRLWKVTRDGDQGVLRLPKQPRFPLGVTPLPAAVDFASTLILRHANCLQSGHSLAIRQLYRGEEVGRITWRFRSGSS